MARDIAVAAIVFTDEAGRVLCVRKHSSPRFQLPGGKPEPGEGPVATALRETREEVGIDVDAEGIEHHVSDETLAALGDTECNVLLHDAVRPLVSQTILAANVAADSYSALLDNTSALLELGHGLLKPGAVLRAALDGRQVLRGQVMVCCVHGWPHSSS